MFDQSRVATEKFNNFNINDIDEIRIISYNLMFDFTLKP